MTGIGPLSTRYVMAVNRNLNSFFFSGSVWIFAKEVSIWH